MAWKGSRIQDTFVCLQNLNHFASEIPERYPENINHVQAINEQFKPLLDLILIYLFSEFTIKSQIQNIYNII